MNTSDIVDALNKIQAEANALIAERDALKQDLRKARDACQRMREERDAARKAASGGYQAVNADMIADMTERLKNLGETNRALAVIRKGQKIDTPAQYDALPPGSRVRKADGHHWEKGASRWWPSIASDSSDAMRDLAFPRTVLRIGYSDSTTEFEYTPTKHKIKVGDVLTTLEQIESAPIGTRMHAAKGYTWARASSGWMLDGDSDYAISSRNMAMGRIWIVTHVPA